MTTESALSRFLTALYAEAPPDAFVEMRYRYDEGMRRNFFSAQKLTALASVITARSAGTDVYVGVIARRHRGGRRADLVGSASVVWADCDTEQASAALGAFTPAPSLILRSGSGSNLHGYWLLSAPIALDAIESANRRIAYALGADMACTDGARIMRPASSLNWKRTPPAEVRLDPASTGERHPLARMLADLPRLPEPARRRITDRVRVPTGADSLLDIEPAVYVEQLAGVTVPRSGKIVCPFHADRTPSLQVYADAAHGWYCYGCRRGGSIFDFAGHVYGLTTRGEDFLALRARLTDVFGVTSELGS